MGQAQAFIRLTSYCLAANNNDSCPRPFPGRWAGGPTCAAGTLYLHFLTESLQQLCEADTILQVEEIQVSIRVNNNHWQS